jgi:hypothetical protein
MKYATLLFLMLSGCKTFSVINKAKPKDTLNSISVPDTQEALHFGWLLWMILVVFMGFVAVKTWRKK